MLVLSRHCDEAIMIGDDVEITIVDIRGDKVRVGINAPARIPVHRKEIYEAIRLENEQAISFAASPIASIPAKDRGDAPLPNATRVVDRASVNGSA